MSIRGGSSLRPYLVSCGLLTIPILVWNIAFTRYLPPPLAPAEFWRDIPRIIVTGENVSRTLVSVLPFLMPLREEARRRRQGLAWFGIGVSVYFASWLLFICFRRRAGAGAPRACSRRLTPRLSGLALSVRSARGSCSPSAGVRGSIGS